MGLNLRMPELSAALARVSLTHLADVNARARSAGQFLSTRLMDSDVVTPPHVDPGCDHVFHKYRLLVRTEAARNALLASDAPVTTWQHQALPLHPAFPTTGEQFANAQYVLDHSVIVGTERRPLSEQRFESVAEWAERVLEAVKS
jgi:dTDP-4-amino-4,6-dideoxygalactose transaminase